MGYRAFYDCLQVADNEISEGAAKVVINAPGSVSADKRHQGKVFLAGGKFRGWSPLSNVYANAVWESDVLMSERVSQVDSYQTLDSMPFDRVRQHECLIGVDAFARFWTGQTGCEVVDLFFFCRAEFLVPNGPGAFAAFA